MPEYSLQLENLSKTYGHKEEENFVYALKDLTLNVNEGTFFGLLGPNGAG